MGGWNTYNFLTERAGELRFSAFEEGLWVTQIYVKITSAKQSFKNR